MVVNSTLQAGISNSLKAKDSFIIQVLLPSAMSVIHNQLIIKNLYKYISGAVLGGFTGLQKSVRLLN